MNFLKRKFRSWRSKLKRRFSKNPVKSFLFLIISAILIYYIAIEVNRYLGILPLTAYLFACIYGISEIIDKPHRTVIWAIGYLLAAIAIAVFFVYLVPAFQNIKDIASIISIIIISFIVIKLFTTSRKLKKR